MPNNLPPGVTDSMLPSNTADDRAAEMVPPADLPSPSEIIAAAVTAERERCAKIADEFVERTNADIAHAIANAIRAGIE